MTFGAHKLVRSEPLLDYPYNCGHRYIASCGKNYIGAVLGPKLLRWNFLQISQLSIRSGAHKLFHRFFDLSQILTAILRKLWRHPATKIRTI